MNGENRVMQRVSRIQTKRSNDTSSPFRPKPSVYLMLFMSKSPSKCRRKTALLNSACSWTVDHGTHLDHDGEGIRS